MNIFLRQNKQAGFTLVELLVGLAISLLVGLIAISYLVTSSRLLTIQNNSDLIQENGRFAFEFLSDELRHAGLNETSNIDRRNSENKSLVEGITTKNICNNDLNIEPVLGTEICNTSLNYTLNGQNVNTDRVAIDYVRDQGATCTGVDIVQEISVVSVYWVADLDGDGIPSLYCQAYTSLYSLQDQGYTNYILAGEASALVDGIESIQIQYGIDTDDDENNDIESYSIFSAINALDAEGNNNISDVRSVKIGFLISSGQAIPIEQNTEDNSGAAGAVRTYTVLDQTFDFPTTDRIERKTLSTTVFFPNLPAAIL